MLSLRVAVTPPPLPDSARVRRGMRAVLRVFDRYYRGRVAQRFAAQGPGWPPRQSSASQDQGRDARAARLAEHHLERKLVKELVRAQKRLALGRGKAESVARRQLVVQHLYRQLSGWQGPLQKSDRRAEASLGKLRERLGRAHQAASSRLLGRLPASMRSATSGWVLTVKNMVPFSGVQNEGGVVGHGAELPPRPFNYFDGLDVEVLAEVAANVLLAEATS